MKKLTLEKAQELLEFLKGKAASGDITISQENYLQAMELAVMALSAMQAKPIGYISERNLNALGKQFSVCVKHEPVMVRPIPLYTTPQPAHTEQVPDMLGFDPALAGSEATVITNYFTPDGWKLVPIELTEDMLKAGCRFASEHNTKGSWSQMLRAAPKPEAL